MKMKKIVKTIFAALPFLLGISFSSAQQNLIVITNSKGAPSELKREELIEVMKGQKQRWADGTRISIALMKSSTPTGEATSQVIYGMSGDEVNKYWLALVFQGKAKAPVFFSSMADLENYISQTPGAIGIVEDTPQVRQKTIMIDGKKSL
jgi:hypothetical protein